MVLPAASATQHRADLADAAHGVLVACMREIAQLVTRPQQDAQFLEPQVGSGQDALLLSAVASFDKILGRLSMRFAKVNRICLGSLAVVGKSQVRKSVQATKTGNSASVGAAISELLARAPFRSGGRCLSRILRLGVR